MIRLSIDKNILPPQEDLLVAPLDIAYVSPYKVIDVEDRMRNDIYFEEY